MSDEKAYTSNTGNTVTKAKSTGNYIRSKSHLLPIEEKHDLAKYYSDEILKLTQAIASHNKKLKYDTYLNEYNLTGDALTKHNKISEKLMDLRRNMKDEKDAVELLLLGPRVVETKHTQDAAEASGVAGGKKSRKSHNSKKSRKSKRSRTTYKRSRR
jgi:hypothetical protein